jgi:hypothetical protein
MPDMKRNRSRRNAIPRTHRGYVWRVDGEIEIVDTDSYRGFKLVGLGQASFRLGAGGDRRVAGPTLGAPIMLATRAERSLLGLSMA